MKAARILRFGPPSVITDDDLPQPKPAPGQLLVRVKAAGVGNWDALMYGNSIPAGTVGGDLFEYINFQQRYDIDVRIQRALKRSKEFLEPLPLPHFGHGDFR
jgi:hypothetical protein